MEIENTGWKSFAEEDKALGGLIFGYRAPANSKALEGFPSRIALLEVRNADGSFCRLMNLRDKDKAKFAEGQWLAIMDSRPVVGQVNENFKSFEKALEERIGKPLPDDRFDQFVDWSNPRAWKKENGGYSLDISHLSSEKKEALVSDFKVYGAGVKGGRLSVMAPRWVKTLEFEWEMAEKQRSLYAQAQRESSR